MLPRTPKVLKPHEREQLELERTFIRDGLLRNMRKGDVRYIIPENWHHQWKKYVGMGGYGHSRGDPDVFPGPIDLSQLVDENGNLKRDLVELRDYRAVPEDSWRLIMKRYGLTEKSPPPILRNVIVTRYKNNCSVEEIELYPPELVIRLHSDLNKILRVTFSRLTPFETIISFLRKNFDIPANAEVRLWHKRDVANAFELVEESWLLERASSRDGSLFILETRPTPSDSWPSSHPDFAEKATAVLGFSASFPVQDQVVDDWQ